jgi:tetratricopeptide (TPR) repeat protein
MASSLKEDARRQARRKMLIGTPLLIAAATGVAFVVARMPAKRPPNNEASPYAQKSSQLTVDGWKFWENQDQEQSLESAIDSFEEAVKLNPENVSAWNGLGWANLNSGNTTAAQAAFEKAVKLSPKLATARNGLGQIALYQRNYDVAEKQLLQAALLDQTAWFGLAKLYLLTGNYDQARSWAQKLLVTGKANPLVEDMLKAAQTESVPPDLRKLLEPSPRTAELDRARKLLGHARFAEAQAIYQTLLAKDPKDIKALIGMGWSLIDEGDASSAKSYFGRALAVEPNAADALNGLARIASDKGDIDGAIKIWKDVAGKTPGFHAGTVGLANAYLKKGDYARALPFLEQWAAAEPHNVQIEHMLKLARANVKGATRKSSP